MVVDLPTPGEPVMPTRIAWPVCGSSSCTSVARGGLMIGAAAFDQRDGARQRGAVAGANPLGDQRDIDLFSGGHCRPSSSPSGRAPPKIATPSGVRYGFSCSHGTKAT